MSAKPLLKPEPISKDLSDVGFTIPPDELYQNLIISLTAAEKTGKTDWALRTTPETVCIIGLDTGTDEIVRKLRRELKRKILFKAVEIPALRNSLSVADRMKLYETIWNDFREAVMAAIANKAVKTLVVDTATEAWELCRLARFGKLTQVLPIHYGPINAEFRELVRNCAERTDLVSIWIHKQKKEYKVGKDGKDAWTGKWERAGFGDMPYLADVNAEPYFYRRERDGGEIERGFGLRVVDCRQNMELAGTELEGVLCSFECLAQEIFEGDWEG